jgi:GxxExxY protein
MSADENNDSNWVENDLVYKVIGAAMAVSRGLKHGLREKTCERALEVEFRHLGLEFTNQHQYPVYYRGEKIDVFIPDLEVERKVIVETKVADKIIDDHIGQLLNYLKITGLEVGLILNFRYASLQYKKVVYQPHKHGTR